jgi:hypothetical protein
MMHDKNIVFIISLLKDFGGLPATKMRVQRIDSIRATAQSGFK